MVEQIVMIVTTRCVSCFIFKVNYVFIEEKDNPVEKVVIDEEELDGIEINRILNLENLPRTVFID